MPIIVVGLSHRTAPVEIRERLAFATTALPDALRRLMSSGAVDEAVILSTCNRVEICAATGMPVTEAGDRLLRFLSREGRIDRNLSRECYTLTEPESLQHLFRVAAGLDSMVLGETEILGQVKKAYETARQTGCTGRRLNKAFQRAFNAAKLLRTQTNIQRGSVSVGSIAVELAERIFSSLSDRTVLVIGAGDTGEKTARALLTRGARDLLVTNRSFDRAEALATELGGHSIPFGDWLAAFDRVDIVISSTAAPDYILGRAALEPLMRRRNQRPLLLIDIAVPRDIDPEVNLMDNVYLYNIDDLQAIAGEARRQREEDIAKCEAVIAEKVRGLLETGRCESDASLSLACGAWPLTQRPTASL